MNTFQKKLNKINTRTRILSIILPMTILPILFLSILFCVNISQRMFQQTQNFYFDIINQTTQNINFYYNQHAMSVSDISSSTQFQALISRKEETSVNGNLSVPEIKMELTDAMCGVVNAKTGGEFFLIELNRSDRIAGTPYTVNTFNRYTDITIDVKQLLEDPIFEQMQENMSMKPVVGCSQAIKGYRIENRTTFFTPYLEPGVSKIQYILVVIETADFISSLYDKNTSLKFGTIYVLDQFGNLQSCNHPSINDYYDYDKDKKKYILTEGDDPHDPDEGMSFAEYRMLNTDSEILKIDAVSTLLQEADESDSDEPLCKVISYKNKKFICVASVCHSSKTKVIYFHPIQQIFRPLLELLLYILIITLIIVLLISVGSLFFSRYLTKPVIDLANANRIVKGGDYTYRLNSDDFFGEYIELSDSFNDMAKKIHNYSENMEELVKKQTVELQDAVKELTLINEKNSQDLLMAQKIQSSLIPKVFPVSNLLQFSALYLPMEAIGGDLYDVYQISENLFAVVILDVCGHGVPAALITTMAKISFSNNAKKNLAPEEVVNSVNNELVDAIGGSGDYFTAFYCVIDIQEHSLTYTNAGHNSMILLHKDDTVSILNNNGPVIGVIKNLPYISRKLPLNKDDRLILYTDGVIEARGISDNLYSEERLLKLIHENRSKEIKNFVENLYNDLKQFKGSTPTNDDIALLVIDVAANNI